MAVDTGSLGIVVGLAAEARMARRLGGMIAIGGGTAAGARVAVRGLAERAATALLSFGLAGGLDPALRPGTILVPEAILVDGRLLPTDPALCRMLGGTTPHRLLGADRIIADPGAKQARWRETGCAAVDLESGAVASVARECGLPFVVLRVICDPADRALPPAAVAALGAEGAVVLGRVLASLARRPGQLVALVALGTDAARARHALLRRVRRIRRHGTFTLSSAHRAGTHEGDDGHTR
ncbi:MAG TPA: hypothetical protein VFW75_10775 [Acetobacteraceae bacterium]|nr:hypothetical protein [Acetobacteraceae bacterium]